MRYGEFYCNSMKCTIVQVSKPKVHRLYNEGKTIYLQSCNMRFDNMWQSACPISKSTEQWIDQDFDKIVNEFTYYNCDNERGKYPNFFVKKEDA